jgi:curved DNA-binding protein
MEYKDYYKTLGVAKMATASEIKKAYRKLAVKYHPDKTKDDKAAEEKFKEVTEAYEVLKDPEKRKKYDELGANWKMYEQQGPNGGAPFGRGGYGSPFGGGRTQQEFSEEYSDLFGGGGFSDFFESFFGGQGGGGSRGPYTSQRGYAVKGQDHQASITIPLQQAYEGVTPVVNVSGKRLRIKIKPGIEDGQTLKIGGKGGESIQGGQAGDLFLKINIEQHPNFTRKGNDLYTDVSVDVYTAILGSKATINTLKGPVSISIPAGTDNGKVLRLKDMGMPHYGNATQFGYLFATVRLTTPKNLSKQEIELVRQLKALRETEAASVA